MERRIVRRGQLKRVSDKRRRERPERERVVTATLKRAGYRCEAAELVPEVECRGGLDTDEIVLRSGRAGGHLEVGNTLALCASHHRWKHDNDAEAQRRGLRVWGYDCVDLAQARPAAQHAQAAYLRGER